MEVRKDPAAHGLDKRPTEASIKDVLANDKRVIEVENKFFYIYELSHLLEHAVRAFEHRKELLKATGELWRAGYYSDVPEVCESQGQRDMNKKNLREETKLKMRRRK